MSAWRGTTTAARTALLLAGLNGAACEPERGAASAPDSAPVMADHHVHVLSPELVQDWKAVGVPFSRPDSAYTSVSAILDVGAIPAFLVSMAHVYGLPEFRRALDLSIDAELLRVRRANDHVAHEVARAPASLVGFCSVHLLRAYAIAEIERCRHDLDLAGLKLHLSASGIDLHDREHLHLLATLASTAAREGLALLIHLAAVDGELRADELRAFIEHVVEPNPDLELYLAHLGGNGGYRRSARRVVHAFTAYLRESEVNSARTIYFELSGTLLARTTDGVPASSRADARRLAADLQALGLDRVVFGSDYPVFDPGSFAGLLQRRLSLSPAELTTIAENRGPVFARAAERAMR